MHTTTRRPSWRRWRHLRAGVLAAAVLTAGAVPVAAAPATAASLSIDQATVTEGDHGTTNAVFTVTLSKPSGKTTTVSYATGGGTATSGSDYFPTSGSLTFNKKETTKTILVPVVGDTIDEADETFFVQLTDPGRATITDGTGEGTILDDDEAPPPPATHTLSVDRSGPGTVTSDPAGIDCGSDCSEDYTEGTSVTLTATPDADASFTGWTGDCSGTGPCTVVMDANRSVGATFVADEPPTMHPVSVAITNQGGHVGSDPAGIDCDWDGEPGVCVHGFPEGSTVTLTATPRSGMVFAGWLGDCEAFGTDPCTLVMDAGKSATAHFTDLAPASYALTVTAEPAMGTGRITSSPAGIDCAITMGVATGACSVPFDTGTFVVLTATPADPTLAGSQVFAGWGGACAGYTDTCVVQLDMNKTVSARFVACSLDGFDCV